MQTIRIELQRAAGPMSFNATLDRGQIKYQAADGDATRAVPCPPDGFDDPSTVSCKVGAVDGASLVVGGRAWLAMAREQCLNEFLVLSCCEPAMAKDLVDLADNSQPYFRSIVKRPAGHEAVAVYTTWPDTQVVREHVRTKELAGRLTWEMQGPKGEALDIEGDATLCTLAEIASEMVQELQTILSRRLLDAIHAAALDPIGKMAEFTELSALWVDTLPPREPEGMRLRQRPASNSQ